MPRLRTYAGLACQIPPGHGPHRARTDFADILLPPSEAAQIAFAATEEDFMSKTNHTCGTRLSGFVTVARNLVRLARLLTDEDAVAHLSALIEAQRQWRVLTDNKEG